MEILQPKLRFPEFEGNWELKQFKEVTSLITKGTTPQNFSENGINFIKIECLNGHNIDTSKCLFIDEKTHTKELKRSILKEDDLLFAIAGATIGKCTIVTKEALPANTNQALAIIRLKEKENKDYIFQILTSEGMSKYIKDNISVGAQPNLNLEQINSFSFSYPSLEEQTKIANFLSEVDEKLNLLKEKKALLEDYKKGIMQKIFNQEIRFKDDNGNDFDDWIETNLGGICEFENGKAHENEIDENGDFVVINSKFVSTNGRVRKYTNKIISRLDKNDIVMVMSDVPNGKAIAKCYYVEEDNKYSLNQRICKIRVIKNDSKYIYYLINRNPYYLAFDSGVGQTNLRKDEVLDCPLYIPKDIKEQNKIANFLTSIDEKIELVSNQIQDSQEYKKGLLQQMFV